MLGREKFVFTIVRHFAMLNLAKISRSLVQKAYSILAPPFCFYCRDYLYQAPEPPASFSAEANNIQELFSGSRVSNPGGLCGVCARLIKPIISERIKINAHYTIAVHAVSAYEEPLKSLILAKRWSDYAACKQLAHILWDYSVVKEIPFECIVPVSAHWTRVASRGYNQAQVLAQELARLSGRPMLEALKRVRRTQRQSECAAHERAKNVIDAFTLSAQGSMIQDCRVLLVDDLMTTGATLFAAGK